MAGSGPGQGRLSSRRGPHLSTSGPGAAGTIVPAAQAAVSVAGGRPCWVLVAGNDDVAALLWSLTPLTWAQLGASRQTLPATGMSWEEARAAAARLGGRLPTSAEWAWMAAGGRGRRYPWGEAPWTPRHANLRASGHGQTLPVGRFPHGATPEGLLDVAGNVWEWTATRTCGRRGVVIRGGSYQSPARYAARDYVNEVPAGLRSAGIGVRVVREP